ncbi:MAG: hypothetical protein JXB47_20825 [Anaerolineae bacterium]|nr:hypothetical protein [Anaerolineae bacterium]
MPQPVVDCVVKAVTDYLYKVWTGLAGAAIKAVEGVQGVASPGGDLHIVLVSRRYDPEEVIAEIRRLSERR